jgi:O-antigen biosynthesis protein WbqP
MMYRFVKRGLDLILALIAGIILLPIFIIFVIWIPLDSKGPAFFRQTRIGRDNQHFQIYKFRSMRIDTPDIPTDQLQNPAMYVTRLGAFIRKTSIDELPQLINIIKGEMSFVGPRPALYNQEELIQKRTSCGVHRLLPGLSGHAQINGRDDLTDEEKVRYDEEYLQMASFWLDIKIICKTVLAAALSKGVKR